MESLNERQARFGMVIDLDKCNGCGACMVACAVENNIPPADATANDRTGITWMRVYTVQNRREFPDTDIAFIPMFCQQCEQETPCVTVCPQNAVEMDESTGIVGQVPQRCLGCRYCMTACPYHARYFNWRDPEWPAGMEKQLNPNVSPRMRGVAEKCNFCHGRLHEAKAKAAVQGRRRIQPEEYIPACVESCPHSAIVFGDLDDGESEVSTLSKHEHTFRFLSRLGTEPKVYFHSKKDWVKQMAENTLTRSRRENVQG